MKEKIEGKRKTNKIKIVFIVILVVAVLIYAGYTAWQLFAHPTDVFLVEQGSISEEIKAEAKRRRDEKESKSKYYHENAKCNRNLEGNKIGKLKVIKLLSEKSGIDAEYLCRCDCGNAVKSRNT